MVAALHATQWLAMWWMSRLSVVRAFLPLADKDRSTADLLTMRRATTGAPRLLPKWAPGARFRAWFAARLGAFTLLWSKGRPKFTRRSSPQSKRPVRRQKVIEALSSAQLATDWFWAGSVEPVLVGDCCCHGTASEHSARVLIPGKLNATHTLLGGIASMHRRGRRMNENRKT